MSPHSKTLILAALAFCALAFAQGPLPPAGGAAGPGAPGGAALNGAITNQTAVIGAGVTIATCPSGTPNFCTYLIGLQLECNPANPATGTGSLLGNLFWTDAFGSIGTQVSNLNVATCSATLAGSTSATWLPRFVIAKPGSAIQYTVGGTMTGSYNYDLAWFAQRLS